ncbi:helix-turn-helix domain-containing protein [Ensifer sp. MJa1]|uniref:helix-turn-helix domain-containing protein n=1 Tax=Ensifer sp. MJa1 TaxID=2919888 RepID=UPI00300AE335
MQPEATDLTSKQSEARATERRPKKTRPGSGSGAPGGDVDGRQADARCYRAGSVHAMGAEAAIGASAARRAQAGAEGRADNEKRAGDEGWLNEETPPASLDDLAGLVAAEVRAQTRRIAALELALADAEARILSQAKLICAATLAADGDLFSRRPVREIVEEVLGNYPGITWEQVIGVGRERRLVEPRHRCMSAVYGERPDLSLPALGRIFHRDHTSVLHAVNKRGEGDRPPRRARQQATAGAAR